MDELAGHYRGYRWVLHDWARRKLKRYGHVGPFDITDVHVYHERGNGSPDTPADDDVVVMIQFRHPGGCPDWSRPEWPPDRETRFGVRSACGAGRAPG